MSRKENLQLLADKPFSPKVNGGSKFGYKDVSATIIDIIQASPRPFTIGLFGKWGRGKSTVLEEVSFGIDKRKYTFVKFDVWKYEGDSLRRSFLIDIANQINDSLKIWDKLKGQRISPKAIEQKLYNTESAPKTTFKPDYKGLIVSAVAFIVIYFLTRELETTKALSIAIASLPFLVELIKSIDPTQIFQKVNFAKSPAGSPEQFEKIFKEDILDAARGTLVVAIDNLDRTQSHKTAELLSTIKTFLNNDDAKDNVVFLIAADNLAIKQHIKRKYSKEEDDHFSADEFLQKFFNVTIDMPELISTEVSEYTASLLDETNIDLEQRDEVLYLISLFFNKNPREIKQFINNLVAYYMQIKNAHETYGFDESFLSKNTPFIVFLLIMRERFLDAYISLKQDVMDGEGWSEIKQNRLTGYFTDSSPEATNYSDFISKTRHVNPSRNNIAAFFSLRTSDIEKLLPGWDIFASNLESGEVEASVKVVEEFETKALTQQLVAMLRGALANKTRFTILSRTILGVIAESKSLKANSNFTTTIFDIVLGNTQDTDIEKVFTEVTLRTVLNGLENTKDAVKKDFIGQIATYMESQLKSAGKGDINTDSLFIESYASPILDFYLQNVGSTPRWKSNIQKLFETTSDIFLFDKASKNDTLKKMISDTAYSSFAESIDQSSIDNKTAKYELEILASLTSKSRMPGFLLKSCTILSLTGQREQKDEYVTVIAEKVIEFPQEVSELDQASVEILSREMLDARSNEATDKHLLYKGLIVLSSNPTNTLRSEIDPAILNYITSEDIHNVVNLTELIHVTKRANEFDSSVSERIRRDPISNYALLGSFLDESLRQSILEEVATNIGGFEESIESYVAFLNNNAGTLNDYDSTILEALKKAYSNNQKRDQIKRMAHHNANTNLKGSLKKPLREAIKNFDANDQEG